LACRALPISRAGYFRHKARARSKAAADEQTEAELTPAADVTPAAEEPEPCAAERRKRGPRALSEEEEQAVEDTLTSERFADMAPAEIEATLMDEGSYLCSVSTMYRLLRRRHAVRERRNQLRHPQYDKPELLATAPNQVWSWDITKLKAAGTWTYFYLYVIIDIFSRYVVGWCVTHSESTGTAKELILDACLKQNISEKQLTIHADRGSAMTSHGVARLLSDLGVDKTHSRPHVSNDNPYSEAQFKTLKYRPEFPQRFGSLAEAQDFCADFFRWYNTEHRHSGIAMLTPECVHYGRAEQTVSARQKVLDAAYARDPERFVRGCPRQLPLPTAAWINPPEPSRDDAEKAAAS